VSPPPDDAYNEVTTAKADISFDVLLCLLQPFQSGWATLHLNLSDYNDTDECNARTVEQGTCILFSGHSKLESTYAVNSWVFGAMVGNLLCGYFTDIMGRMKLLFFNCFFMIGGAVLQASVSNIWPFAVGRAVSGIASRAATGAIGTYVNELSPPHLRSHLGLGLQISTTRHPRAGHLLLLRRQRRWMALHGRLPHRAGRHLHGAVALHVRREPRVAAHEERS